MSHVSPAARDAVAGLLAEKEASYLEEYTRLVEAFFAVAARTGSVDPKVTEIVAESGLSNQAFYKHFRSKDDLLLAVLDDGRHRLVGYLEHRMALAPEPIPAIEQWIRGVLAQAADPDAAQRSRPFAIHGGRLAALHPDARGNAVHRLRELLAEPIARGVAESVLPGSALDRVDLVFWTGFDAMERHLVAEGPPTTAEIDGVVSFSLAGLGAR